MRLYGTAQSTGAFSVYDSHTGEMSQISVIQVFIQFCNGFIYRTSQKVDLGGHGEGLFFIADILGGNKIVLVGSVIQEQITKGRNQPFAAALSAVLMVLTSVMIRLYRKITGTSQLEGML